MTIYEIAERTKETGQLSDSLAKLWPTFRLKNSRTGPITFLPYLRTGTATYGKNRTHLRPGNKPSSNGEKGRK